MWFNDSRGRKYQRGSQLNYLGNDVSRSQILFDRLTPMRVQSLNSYGPWAMRGVCPKIKQDRELWASEHFVQIMRRLVMSRWIASVGGTGKGTVAVRGVVPRDGPLHGRRQLRNTDGVSAGPDLLWLRAPVLPAA